MAAKFIWYELATPDPAAAIAFYGAVVGWTAFDFPGEPAGSYSILSAGERGVGGVRRPGGECEGMAPGWLGYVAVQDTDAVAGAVAEAGGAILMPPADIPGVGRFALVADPGGAAFYLLRPQPQGDAPPPPLPEPGAAGTVGWHELCSESGEEAAFDFYRSQFGWETFELMDMGPMGKYRIFGAEGAAIGGMMDKPANIERGGWSFYVNVHGIDAAADRVVACGGQVRMAPHQVPDGSWVLKATDPQGALFALVSTTR